jgi:hypothetical protein
MIVFSFFLCFHHTDTQDNRREKPRWKKMKAGATVWKIGVRNNNCHDRARTQKATRRRDERGERRAGEKKGEKERKSVESGSPL